MKSPLAQKPETATSATPGPVASFLRFVLSGGGVGVLSSFAVTLLAMTMPWAVSNAIITVASTLLCTELHARFTFAKGRSAGWREHWQSAGSATAAYLATSIAMYVLHLAQPSAGTLTEQIVYLSASGLAGAGRFIVLRLYVFAGRRGRTGRTTRPLMRQGQGQGPVPAPGPTGVRQPSSKTWPNGSRPELAA
ncbi:GtrA family protein [Streptomyces sp. NBC_00286]|uniref:GtrA family protein n=1 Tax=Streptomyces sp. NBC_00286 TaxID=2975701 RepID=UPI002E2D0EA8|nr:GtrA family protein [Streptomyces sp. NBC_00286]